MLGRGTLTTKKAGTAMKTPMSTTASAAHGGPAAAREQGRVVAWVVTMAATLRPIPTWYKKPRYPSSNSDRHQYDEAGIIVAAMGATPKSRCIAIARRKELADFLRSR